MTKMNPNAKALWVEALRSGKYQQVRGRLRKNAWDDDNLESVPGYCCLGVLCVVAEENGVELPEYVLASHTFPSADVTEWAGLDTPNPRMSAEDGSTLDAASWNDDKHKSFAEIADMIERSL